MMKPSYLIATAFLSLSGLAFAGSNPRSEKPSYLSNEGLSVNKVSNSQALSDLKIVYEQALELLEYYSFLNKELKLEILTTPLNEAKRLLDSNSGDTDEIDAVNDKLSDAISLLNQSNVKTRINEISSLYDIIKGEEDETWAKDNNIPLRAPMNTQLFMEKFSEATSIGDYNSVLKLLNYARKLRAAIQHADNFEHLSVEAGNFYLYNLGTGLFFQDGSDWCTHAALGNPGLEVKLIPYGNGYKIFTGLGGGYLNNRGYTDTSEQSVFVFKPVAGKENVYNIVQEADQNKFMAYFPDASVDAGNGNEMTVGTEVTEAETAISLNDEEAQWILVSREERYAQIEYATESNPVDLTFLLSRPGFNRVQRYDMLWWINNFGIWEEGTNQDDCAIESWNTNPGAYFSYQLEDLPEGVYKVCLQGFYRNGSHETQANNSTAQNAVFFAGETEVPLPNITSYSNLNPSDATVAGEYNYPYDIPQATKAFRAGLYNVYAVVKVFNGYTLPIGVEKKTKGENEDWIVADNLRIYYYGPKANQDRVASSADPAAYMAFPEDKNDEDITTGIEEIFDALNVPHDGYYYNLNGFRSKNPPSPGIYILNGKKVVIR